MGSTVHISKEAADSLRLVNTTGVALVVDEFTVMRGKGLMALEAIASLASGALENVDGCEIQVADFDTAEATFAAADLPVYWDPSSKKFSNTASVGHWLIGYSKAAVASGILDVVACEPIYVSDGIATLAAAIADHVADTADAHDASAISLLDAANRFTADEVEAALAELAGAGRTTETVKANAAAIAAATAFAGIPFRRTAVLTSALATTPVDILTSVEVGAGKKAYITDLLASVGGADVWAGTGTKVLVRDKAAAPVTAIELAKAQLGAQAVLGKNSTGVTLAVPVRTGVGMTTAKGLELVADGTFETTGSDLSVTVCGYIA